MRLNQSKMQTDTQNQPQLNEILKQVSRSFYLSIRILPVPMRTPVTIAYLLARAADSMTDSDNINLASRKKYLDDLLNSLNSIDSNVETEILSSTLKPLISDVGEQKLIHFLPEIIICFHQLSAEDKSLVQQVVITLIRGMQNDLSLFESKDHICALENQVALEEYTYLVAGCVGEFWTKTAIAHLSSVSHWNEKTQSTLGIEFGKALQLTNILRDIAKDARLNRCYLPNDVLQDNKLTTNQLLDKANDHLFRPIIFQELTLAVKYFESAENYLLSTPRSSVRLRLASIWPILIGLKTLELIASKENFLDPDKTIKVQRQWVYGMLIRSFIIVASNSLLKRWIQNTKNNIQYKIQCL